MSGVSVDGGNPDMGWIIAALKDPTQVATLELAKEAYDQAADRAKQAEASLAVTQAERDALEAAKAEAARVKAEADRVLERVNALVASI